MDVLPNETPQHEAGPESEPAENASAASPNDPSSTRNAVLAFLEKHSCPAAMPKQWRFLERTPDIRHLELPVFELGPRLKQEFGETRLFDARVIKDLRDVNCPPPIFGDDGRFVVDRDTKGCPADIYTAKGALFCERAPSVSRALLRTSAGADGPVPLIVVETIEDLQVLRGLGFEAILSIGLNNIGVAEVRELFSESAEVGGWAHQLLISAWFVTELRVEMPPRARSILERLALIQTTYAHDPARRFTRWRPTFKVRDAVRDARTLRDTGRARQLIESSFPEPIMGKKWQYHVKQKCPSYLDARSQLYRAVAESMEIPAATEVKKYLDSFHKAFHDEVLAGLYAMAGNGKHPVDRAISLQAAEALEHWFESQRVVKAARKVITNTHPGHNWNHQGDDFDERLRLNNMLLKFGSFLRAG